MAIKHKPRMLISINFQSEEVKSVYDNYSKILEWFRLLYYFFSLLSDPLLMEGLSQYIAFFGPS